MQNFHETIARAARAFPDRIAIEWVGADGTETTTYAALMAAAEGISVWLTGSGVTRGDRVAVIAANDARWVAAYLGVLHCGAIAVPLDTAYTAEQVATILSDSGARVVFAGSRYVDTMRDAAARITVDTPRVAPISDFTVRAGPTTADPALAAARVEPEDAAAILYTSGTTADPKGVVLTHTNLNAERDAVLAVITAAHEDVVLGVLPLFHALAEMANLWLPLSIGARVVFLETVNSTTLLDALQTRGITILACVPQFYYLIHQRVAGEIARRGVMARAVFRGLLGANRWTRDRLHWNFGRRAFSRVHRALGPHIRLLITGGSRFDPDIARDLYGLGVSLYNGYGLTETSGAATIARVGDRFSTSVGHPLPGVDIRIAAATNNDDGEILVRGPIVMREYYRHARATAEAIHDGWLHTGDLGRLDADGRVHITGRLKDVIVLSSGKNLYPEEIEAHYRQSPFIKELCVLGLARPDEPSAERLHAVIVPDDVVLRERGIVNVRELIRFELEGLSVRLPSHKRILGYDIARDPLPRTTTGKLKRADIARQARERIAAPARIRETSTGEREWASESDHAASLAAIAERLGIPTVQPDANLELDLGLDSMERVELLARLEARRGTRVSPERRATIFTLRHLVDAVDSAPAVTGHAREGSAANDPPWGAILAEPSSPALTHELGRSKLVRSLVIHGALRVCMVVLTPVLRLRVTGRANIPPDGPFILAPNHQTFLDGFFIGAAIPYRAFRRIYFVGAAEFFETRFMAWGAQAINIVPLDPDANLVNAMQAAATGLRLKKVLMLFPEGERTIDGAVKPFRKGAAILASHLHVPVVPVGLDGLFPLWPRGRGFQWSALAPWRRLHVTIAFGPPITIAGEHYVEGTDVLTRAVKKAKDG